MRPILLAAGLLAASAAPASADTVIWTGEVHVEKWVTDDGSEFYGYWYRVFGNIPGVRQFTFGGFTYTVDLFYITNTPRSLLAGAERRGSPGILPTDRGLAWLVDGERFELADHDRSFPDGGVAVWDGSGLDWEDGQVVSVQLVQGATPVPALPTAGAVLLALALLVRGVETVSGQSAAGTGFDRSAWVTAPSRPAKSRDPARGVGRHPATSSAAAWRRPFGR